MPDGQAIQWVSWPLRDERPRKTASLLAIMVGTAAISFMLAPVYGLLAVLMLFILLGPYFLPSRFEVTEGGVLKRFPLFSRNRPWSVYKRFVLQEDGVFLSPFPHPSRLDSFRGDFLRFSRTTDRQAVMDLVRKNVGGT
jgi:hypothetical protein